MVNTEEQRKNLEAHIGKVVRIRYHRDCRNEYGDVLVSVPGEFHDKSHTVFLGHCYDLNAQRMVSGGLGLRYSEDTIEIFDATKEQFDLWCTEYEKFHKAVVEDDEDGHDFCEENITKLTY